MYEVLTPEEAAPYLRVSVWTLRRWIRNGAFPAVRLPGGFYRIRRDDLERFLQPVGEPRA